MDLYLIAILLLLILAVWLIYSLYKEWRDDPFNNKR